jgi:Coenzyme PQQ synthesis protein D (PqqD)
VTDDTATDSEKGFDTSALVQRSANHVACDMGSEVVILDLTSGMYYGLDVLGARIWSLIEHPASLGAIRDAIMADYEVDAATCERDILVFLQQMKTIGLVEVTYGSSL